MVARITLAVSPELESALRLACLDRDESRSQLVETMLRENPVIAHYVNLVRTEPSGGGALGGVVREAKKRGLYGPLRARPALTAH
jgi:hypothetical protein